MAMTVSTAGMSSTQSFVELREKLREAEAAGDLGLAATLRQTLSELADVTVPKRSTRG